MRFRFATWNVNSRSLQHGHADLIRWYDIDMLALQEATSTFHQQLADTGLFAWDRSSLALRPVASDESRGRSLGCSLFGSARFQPVRAFLLEAVPLPERTLAVTLASPEGDLTACSFHAPPGVNWGEIKPRTFRAIAAWLAPQRERVLFGMDANAPKVDHPDHARSEWWWSDEALLPGRRSAPETGSWRPAGRSRRARSGTGSVPRPRPCRPC